MNIRQLRLELKRNGIKDNVCLVEPQYEIEGALCLLRNEDGTLHVVLNERGNFFVDRVFNSEHEACMYFLMMALSEPTYYKDFSVQDLDHFEKKKTNLFQKYGFYQDIKDECKEGNKGGNQESG